MGDVGLPMNGFIHPFLSFRVPVSLIEKSEAFSPGGRFSPTFIHQVGLIIITGLNKFTTVGLY